mmetsp:Transcript_5339/g.6559  ORF Transcript_5339/g.6559 Transcript_5339/m.6559 type:complete len:98 (+) Transcript_5339:60-353(+)
MSEEVKQTSARRGGRGGKKPNDGEGAAVAGTQQAERPKTAARSGRRGENQAAAAEGTNKDGQGRGRRPQTARQAASAAEGHEETKGPRDGARGGRGG